MFGATVLKKINTVVVGFYHGSVEWQRELLRWPVKGKKSIRKIRREEGVRYAMAPSCTDFLLLYLMVLEPEKVLDLPNPSGSTSALLLPSSQYSDD